MSQNINIRLVTNAGAVNASVPDGSTVEYLRSQNGYTPDRFMISVNRQPASDDTVLTPGSTVVVTPKKIDGNTLSA